MLLSSQVFKARNLYTANTYPYQIHWKYNEAQFDSLGVSSFLGIRYDILQSICWPANNSRDPAARCWQRGSSSFHRKNDRKSAFAILIAIFNSDSSLPTFATTVLTCAGHFRIVPVSVFRVETKKTLCMTYPMHNWAPYWLFTMVYACVPHFNLWRGHKHSCSFQLRIALNLKSTRRYMGIDLFPYVRSRTGAQHDRKI